MGLFERLFGKQKREGHRVREAREREREGDLGGAIELYLDLGLGDDAARALLLRADAESSVEKRIAFCAQAVQHALSDEVRQKALGRKALLAFDTLRKSGASFLESEVLAVAGELEEAGELERAAEAYALAGDAEAEVRVLTAAGAIDKLEERLRASEVATRSQREIEQRLKRISDLDRTGERRAALELCRSAPGQADDPRVADAARAIRGRLLRGPVVELEIDGASRRYALGVEVSVGRGDATIVVGSRAISRRHIRVHRGSRGPEVEDLSTRNGTLLAGARIGASIPVGDGLDLMLGGEVPCRITPAEGGVAIDVAGALHHAPLAPLPVADTGWTVVVDGAGDETFVVLASAGASSLPVLGELSLAPRVELSRGDDVRSARGGVVRLRIPQAGRDAAGELETPVRSTVGT